MSDLLNKASLVMIPSGYKEDVVYSAIPSDGSGDLSFTRASNGTRINSAGLVEVCPWNLVPYSETFNVGWGLQNGATISANATTAPNGTTTASLLYPSYSADIVAPNRTAQPSNAPSDGDYTQFVYAKAAGKNWLALYNFRGSGGTAAWYNLSTGVIGTVASGLTAFIENVGNGWYKCGFTQTMASGQFLYMHIYPTDGDNTNTVTASGTNGIYIWGAQLNIGSTAKPYFPTTDRLNVPRLTYQNGGGGCPSLLLEKQSTNELSYSEDFSNAAWTKLNASVTANDTTSPDGTQNAEKFTEDAVSGVHLFYNNSPVTSASTCTASIFYKKGTRRYFSVKLQIGSNSYTQVFDADGLTTGSNSSNGLTNVSISIVSMGNGWVRASVTGPDPSASTACYMICSLSNSATPTFDSGNFNPSYLGSSSEYGFFWGAQLEPSSYFTSYIPTTSSSATRVADACFKTGISSLIGQTEGTIFCDVNLKVRTAFSYFAINYGGSSSQYIGIYFRTNGIELEVVDTTLQTSIVLANTSTGRFKVAAAYKANDVALYINGVQVGTDTGANIPACDRLDLFAYGQEQPLEYNEAVLFKTRLTNAELASLTTI